MENKFKPSAEQVETAKKIAKKHNKVTVWVNRKGENFLEEGFARNSVSGVLNDYARLDFNEAGEFAEGIKHVLTEQDLEENPMLRGMGLKAGHEIAFVPGAVEKVKEQKPPIQIPAPGSNNGKEQDASPQGGEGQQDKGNEIPTTLDPAKLSIPQLKKALTGTRDVEMVKRIGRAEEGGQNRKGAMDAIVERIKELETPGS